jgi:hypothetical protein
MGIWLAGTPAGLLAKMGALANRHCFSFHPALLLLSTLSTAILVLPLPCWAQEVSPADPGVDLFTDLPNIEFRADVRLFTVMAAVNVAGFDFETDPRGMSPVRRAIRDRLGDLPRDLVSELRLQYSSSNLKDKVALQSAYTSLALLLGPPPDFSLKQQVLSLPPGVEEVLGFEQLLTQFHQVAGIAEIWQNYEPVYRSELQRYKPVFRDVINATQEYFRVSARVSLDRSIILMNDLLSQNDVVNARNLERTYYIVVEPAEEPTSNFIQLQHEYLHFLIDPLVAKYGGTILKKRSLLALAQEQPRLSPDFRDRFLLVVGESLIEALLTRMHPDQHPDQEAAKVDFFRRGLIFYPFFLRQLAIYETTDSSLPAFLQDALAVISEDAIQEDALSVNQYEQRLAEERRTRLQEEAKRRDEYEKAQLKERLFEEAGEALAKNDFSHAREKLEELLRLDPGNANASFYMGQVHAQLGDHASAFPFYEAASQSDQVEAWVKAVSIVRMGRYLASQGRYPEARSLFEAARSMEGDLRGAREEAEYLLTVLPAEPD